jgi:hypothetical protein
MEGSKNRWLTVIKRSEEFSCTYTEKLKKTLEKKFTKEKERRKFLEE